MAAAGHVINRELLVLHHGGPFEEPQAVRDELLRLPAVAGFLGATTTERTPIERVVTEQAKRCMRAHAPALPASTQGVPCAATEAHTPDFPTAASLTL